MSFIQFCIYLLRNKYAKWHNTLNRELELIYKLEYNCMKIPAETLFSMCAEIYISLIWKLIVLFDDKYLIKLLELRILIMVVKFEWHKKNTIVLLGIFNRRFF